MEKQDRKRKFIIISMFLPALLFFIVSPFAFPSYGLSYEFTNVSLFESPSVSGTLYSDSYSHSVFVNNSNPTLIQKLSYSSSYINFYNASDRSWIVPIVNESWLTTGKKQSTVVLDSSYTSGNHYKISLQQYDTFTFYNLHLKYDGIVPKSNSVYKISVDYSTFINPSSSLQALFDNGFYEPWRMVTFYYDGQVGEPAINDPSLVTVQNINSAGRKHFTFYFENPFEYFDITPYDPSDYGTGQSLSMLVNFQAIVNPRSVTNTDYVTYDFYGNFPVSYQILSNSEYGEELDQINRSVEELGGRIEHSVEGQTRVILDELVNNTDPEIDSINNEAETNADKIRDVAGVYESQQAVVNDAMKALESVQPFTMPPEASEFLSTTGQMLSNKWILPLCVCGLSFAIIRLILIGVAH